MTARLEQRRRWGWAAALRVLHPFPSLLVAAVTVSLVPFADPGASVGLYVVLGLGMLCYQFSLGIANDVVDAADDALTKPWKPLARGAISRRAAVLLSAGFGGGGLLVTSGLDLVPWLVGAAGLGCGLAYDVHLKRSRLSWLPWAVAFPLVPVWVYTAADAWDALLWWAFPLGGALAIAVYFANQAPGAEHERELGVSGLAQSLGEGASRAIAITLFGFAASASVIVLLFVAAVQAILAAITGAIVFLLVPRAHAIFGREGLFGVLATGAALLSLVFLSAA